MLKPDVLVFMLSSDILDENQIPVMPILHILSTHGLLLSFDLLNLQPTCAGICSPPQPIADKSGAHLFTELAITPALSASFTDTPPQQQGQQTFRTPSSNEQQTNITFNIPDSGATSTPTKPALTSQASSKNLFGSLTGGNTGTGLFGASTAAAKPQTFGFGEINKQQQHQQQPQQQTSIGGFSSTLTFGAKTTEPALPTQAASLKSPALAAALSATPAATSVAPQKQAQTMSQLRTTSEQTKPFLTVTPSYTPPTSDTTRTGDKSYADAPSNSENDRILREMITEEIQLLDLMVRNSLERSRKINVSVCSKEECSNLLKQINELSEIIAQATESTDGLKSEVQSLRLSLFEGQAMYAEAQSKVDALHAPR